MLIPKRFTFITRSSFASVIAATAAVTFCFAGVTTDAFGRQIDSLRSRVYKTQKKTVQPEKKTSTAKKTTVVKKRSALPVRNFTGATYADGTKPLSSNTQLFVTFLAKEPMIEVWLNGKIIGYTDGRSQLSKRLVQGEYNLMAKNDKQTFLPTKVISVRPAQTSFKLYVEPMETPKQAPPAENKQTLAEKSEVEQAVEISNKIRSVLENYANPEKTDSVTLEDWQIVYKGAPLGQLQGFTAVQIEAQRWFASGQIELYQKQYANATAAFNKAQEFMPSSALPFYALGDTYLANEQYAEAAKLYQKALQIDTKLAMAYKKFGDTQRLLNRDKEAMSAYQNAIQLGYRTPETRYRLATLMLDTKQAEQALEMLIEVSKEIPRAEVYISIGTGYEKLKRDVSAIEYYRKAIEADPNSALAHYKLANVYLNQRENDKAKDYLEKAIALDPDGKQLKLTEAQKKLREVSSKTNK